MNMSGSTNIFAPEGRLYDNNPELKKYLQNLESLNAAKKDKIILEAPCIKCDADHNMIIDLGFTKGIIKRKNGAIGIAENETRDVAIIARTGKAVQFIVLNTECSEYSEDITVELSRIDAQKICNDQYVSKLKPGDIIPARVTHCEQYGAFIDIGAGIPSMIPISDISISRINHAGNRFAKNDDIYVVISKIENNRIFTSHRELLGTWAENAMNYKTEETVTGIVRSIKDYGIFVELTPNFVGLAELTDFDVNINDTVSVYIKAIDPKRVKIKLNIIDKANIEKTSRITKYYIPETMHIDKWVYSPNDAIKNIETVF